MGGRRRAMYRVPEQALARFDDESSRAVIAIANSAQAIQPLQLGEGADKPAVLAALTAAAHQHQHRVLALPATQAAADYAEAHRYADTTTPAASGRDNLQSGRWRLPIGSLLIVDDAEHLPADQLRWLIDNAATTNTKLLLTTNTTDSVERHPPTPSPTPSPPTCPGPNTSAPHPTNSGPPPSRPPPPTWPPPPTTAATTPTAKPPNCWPATPNSTPATTPSPHSRPTATPTSTTTAATTPDSTSNTTPRQRRRRPAHRRGRRRTDPQLRWVAVNGGGAGAK